jgi:hypothetical protein
MSHRLLVALSSTIVIAGSAGCGASSTGTPASATSAMSSSSNAADAPSPCAKLSGTIAPDGMCHVHNETPFYTTDFHFPVTYPDMTAVTDYIAQSRDGFVDWLEKNPVPGGIHSGLNIAGDAYSSSSTQSLVLSIETEGGVHPVTTFKAFNYDVDRHTAIEFGTLFKPGARPLSVLNPIVSRELDNRQVRDVSTADTGVDAYQNFAITDDSVIFFIDQDGPFPHYVGSLEIPVSRAELAPLLAGSDAVPPCASGQVTVTAEPPQAAMTHPAVTLTFGLAPGAGPCTIAGYPGVDSGTGGPLLHADRLPRGYMGGLPDGDDEPPIVTLSPSTSAHAVVEGLAVDESGDQCPTYTDLRVTPPDTTETSTVTTTIDACVLRVHPVT